MPIPLKLIFIPFIFRSHSLLTLLSNLNDRRIILHCLHIRYCWSSLCWQWHFHLNQQVLFKKNWKQIECRSKSTCTCCALLNISKSSITWSSNFMAVFGVCTGLCRLVKLLFVRFFPINQEHIRSPLFKIIESLHTSIEIRSTSTFQSILSHPWTTQ